MAEATDEEEPGAWRRRTEVCKPASAKELRPPIPSRVSFPSQSWLDGSSNCCACRAGTQNGCFDAFQTTCVGRKGGTANNGFRRAGVGLRGLSAVVRGVWIKAGIWTIEGSRA